jgi:hypothetical protein
MNATPGKWRPHIPRLESRSFGVGDRRIMVLHPDGERVIACLATGYTNHRGDIPEPEREANAYLIAQAPEMAEVIADLIEWAEAMGGWEAEPWTRARAVLDAARPPGL